MPNNNNILDVGVVAPLKYLRNFWRYLELLLINCEIGLDLKWTKKRVISDLKYRSEITTQPKNNNLDYLIDPTFRNINRLLVLSFKNGNDDPTRYSVDEYYMPLVEIKYFNALIDNKPFFDQPVKNK